MCYRVRWKDLAVVECEGKGCRKSRFKFQRVLDVVRMFKEHGNLDLIRDGDFLMGGFSDGKGKEMGIGS